MDGPRPPNENELPGIIRFLDSELRPEGKWSINSEYPIAFGEANRNNIRIITKEDQVLSHAVLRPIIIKSPAGLFKVAGIGSVVTSSEYRNQGLSTKIIDSCLEASRQHGCDFAILWTNLYDFYRRMGFELAGSEMSVRIDREVKSNADGLRFLESNKVSADAIHRLYSQHTITSLRTIEETTKYLAIPNARVYTAWTDSGQLKAYAIEGKGADLGGYVHEWGGGVEALLALFNHIYTQTKKPITVIVPQHSQNLLRHFAELGFKTNDGFLGMIKILNTQNLFTKIKRYARSIGVADLVLEARDGKFYLGAGQHVFMTDSELDVVKLIFGPLKASEIHSFGRETSDIMERVFPLHMWIWGWDSI